MHRPDRSGGHGAILVVGTGPGGEEHLTGAARAAIAAAEVVVGYQTYLDLIPGLLAGKEVVSSTMMQEVDRCRLVWELAEAGRQVALVSGGDPGVYAMAGLIFELGRQRPGAEDMPVEVIPGLAALNACAARLGAPLMHDFAVISLSDLLTPWEVIQRRLTAAAGADFVVVLYNPRSRRRTGQIVQAREILLAHRAPETPVGIVTAATRPDETTLITTLAEMPLAAITMQSLVIVGSGATYAWNGRMVTPRGYAGKYDLTDTETGHGTTRG